MSSQPGEGPSEPRSEQPGGSGQPSEEELRAAYEAELSRITSSDMILQAAVSLLNIGGRRLGQAGAGAPSGSTGAADDANAETGGRDLEQVRDAIDAVSALLGILERRIPRELRPLRDALSQLQMAYARTAQAGDRASQAPAGGADPRPAATGSRDSEPGTQPGGASGARSGRTNQPDTAPDDERSERPGPAESSGRLWIPGR